MRRALCVGISGGSGSGKTHFAAFLKERLGAAAVVLCQDWYYKDKSGLSTAQSKKLNFDHPSAIEFPLFQRQLATLLEGRPILSPRYDYARHSRLAYTVEIRPAPIVILDGLLLLCHKPLRRMMDLSVYIDVPSDVRLLRRVRRDVEERRVDLEETLGMYERSVRPMHHRFIEPSARYARKIWKPLEDGKFPELFLREIKRAAGGARPQKTSKRT